jgi:ribosomal protein L21E
MSEMKLQKGDRVLCKPEHSHWYPNGWYEGLEGTVLSDFMAKNQILIEFDEDVEGHDGNGIGRVFGKEGRCWWIEVEFMYLSQPVSLENE